MIDRDALVRRHNPTLRGFDITAPLTVGNGEWAFTADATGLQTFPDLYHDRFPLCTAAHWGWHTAPPPAGVDPSALRPTPYDTHGRSVGYYTDATGQEAAFDYRRQNPHRLHLGRIGFVLTRSDGTRATPADLTNIEQTLDMTTGLLHSRFALEGVPVDVLTCAHPTVDMLAVRVVSPLLASGRVAIEIAFPYGSPDMAMADWHQPARHQSTLSETAPRRAEIARALDGDTYAVSLAWSEGAALSQTAPHTFALRTTAGALEGACRFAPSPAPAGDLPTVAETLAASRTHWHNFWHEGGMVDLGDSADSRAGELERRVVLSQWNTALHCAGSLPSAETGLLCNSWYGKFHLEMHWWHSVHFATWGRFARFERSLPLYERILPIARALARSQGYAGARWPKMIGPDGHDSPSPVGPLLLWQQPHPIYYAELCYHHNPAPETLHHWAEIVFATADFMASFAVRDPATGQFVLGPPLKTVSENQPPEESRNPLFELTYWRFGLRVASEWRARLGLPPVAAWETVRANLSPLPLGDGQYLLQEGLTDTYTRWSWEHPALAGGLGMLPGDGVDPQIMRGSVAKIMEVWQWDRTWGWDFPLAAMAAARTGQPDLAVRALLMPSVKNNYLSNGHVYQRPNLPAYLPANGGLLAAVGLMAAGGADGPGHPAPGFPTDGKWSVKAEGITPWL